MAIRDLESVACVSAEGLHALLGVRRVEHLGAQLFLVGDQLSQEWRSLCAIALRMARIARGEALAMRRAAASAACVSSALGYDLAH